MLLSKGGCFGKFCGLVTVSIQDYTAVATGGSCGLVTVSIQDDTAVATGGSSKVGVLVLWLRFTCGSAEASFLSLLVLMEWWRQSSENRISLALAKVKVAPGLAATLRPEERHPFVLVAAPGKTLLWFLLYETF